MTAELQACGRFEWERIVRRCKLAGPVKLVAFVMAQFADQKGRNIRPGTAVLAAGAEMSTRTAERHLQTLRAVGLVEKLTNGGGPNARAATYRLTVPDDLMDRVEMRDQDEVELPPSLGGGRYGGSSKQLPPSLGGGSSADLGGELPPSGTELPPSGDITPANDPPVTCDVPRLHPNHPLDHPIRDFVGDQQTRDRPEPPERVIHLPPGLNLRASLSARPGQPRDPGARCPHGQPVTHLDARRSVPACRDCRTALATVTPPTAAILAARTENP